MSDERMIAIASKLLERTRKGDVGWSDTVDENTFSVAYPEYSVLIRRAADGRTCVLSIQNVHGSEVQSLRLAPYETEFETLDELLQLARRTALKTDEVLDDLLGRLSKEEAST